MVWSLTLLLSVFDCVLLVFLILPACYAWFTIA